MNNNIPLNDYLLAHCNESMERALAAERHPAWQRSCPEMNDIDFIRLGLLRCISVVDSGRHFLQTTEEIHGELLPHSTSTLNLLSLQDAQACLKQSNDKAIKFTVSIWPPMALITLNHFLSLMNIR